MWMLIILFKSTRSNQKLLFISTCGLFTSNFTVMTSAVNEKTRRLRRNMSCKWTSLRMTQIFILGAHKISDVQTEFQCLVGLYTLRREQFKSVFGEHIQLQIQQEIAKIS